MKEIVFTFRGEEIVVEHNDEKSFALDFNGHYLIEIDISLSPTGRAVDGRGNPLTFSDDELLWKIKAF